MAQVKFLVQDILKLGDKEFNQLTGNKLGLGKEKLVNIYYDRMNKEEVKESEKTA